MEFQGCGFHWGGSRSEFRIQNPFDHCASKKKKNPCAEWIHGFEVIITRKERSTRRSSFIILSCAYKETGKLIFSMGFFSICPNLIFICSFIYFPPHSSSLLPLPSFPSPPCSTVHSTSDNLHKVIKISSV